MVKKFISACLILLYLSITVGVAVHECSCENSINLELLISDSACCHESGSQHCGDSHNECCEHEKTDDAHSDCHCKTRYISASFNGEVLKNEQFSGKNNIVSAVFALPSEIIELKSADFCGATVCLLPKSLSPPLIYLNCQLRL